MGKKKEDVVDAEVVEQSTALATTENTALVAKNDQDELAALMAGDAGDGLENVTTADIAIPFLKLFQKGSPECEEGNAKFRADAQPGMVLNTVTNGLVDIRSGKNLFALVVPVSYEKVIAEWRPNQGGKVKDHPMDQAMLDNAARKETQDGGTILVNEDGNILEETAKFHVLLMGANGTIHWAILPCSGSKLGAAKKWMSLINGAKLPNSQKAPMYSNLYKLSSFLDTSKRTGKTFQNYRFEEAGRITDINMYRAAKEFRQAVLEGTVKEAHEGDTNDGSDPDAGNGDNKPPF